MSNYHSHAEPETAQLRQPPARNQVLHGDCIEVMGDLESNSVDFILTDPPYITHYRDRSGRTVANDNRPEWLSPAFAQMHRLLKPSAFCVSFYGWNKVDLFMAAWKAAGFRAVGHIVFRKVSVRSPPCSDAPGIRRCC